MLPSTTIVGGFVETFPRWMNPTGVALTSGLPRLALVSLRAGEVVRKIAFMAGGGGATSPTHQWAALCSTAGAVLAVSADDTTTAWAVSTVKTFTMTSAYTVPTSGLYYLALCVVAATPPSMVTVSLNSNTANTLLPMVAAQTPSNTGGPPAVGASLGALTGSTSLLYGVAA